MFLFVMSSMSDQIYPMCKPQPAQIDCRLTHCKYHNLGTCTNSQPAITLNQNGNFHCWSFKLKDDSHVAQDIFTKNVNEAPDKDIYINGKLVFSKDDPGGTIRRLSLLDGKAIGFRISYKEIAHDLLKRVFALIEEQYFTDHKMIGDYLKSVKFPKDIGDDIFEYLFAQSADFKEYMLERHESLREAVELKKAKVE